MSRTELESEFRQPLLASYEKNDRRKEGNFLGDLNASLENVQKSVEKEEIDAIEMRFGLTPVRRMFCLLALFDLLLIFLLWIIYAQLHSGDIREVIRGEIEAYKFQDSLFDFVIMALLRCLCLLSIYALLKSNKWYMVAMTTMSSTLLAIIKVFYIGNDHMKAGQPISYFIIIATFIVCWSEAWHFDFQVMPMEMKMKRDQLTSTFTGSIPTLPDSISQWRQGPVSEFRSCYSPVTARTLQGSDSSTDCDMHSEFSIDIRDSRIKNRQYIKQGKEALQELLRMMYISENWKVEKKTDDIVVEARAFKNIGKVFKCKTIINSPPSFLFNVLWTNVENQPSWNPGVVDCQLVLNINKKTDICYVVAADAASGLISSRDFISVRRYEVKGTMCLLAGKSITYDDVPERSGIVRGENGPSGYVLISVPNDPNKCEFLWFVNTNLKGWIPQKVIDQALSNVVLEGTQALKKHIATLPKL